MSASDCYVLAEELISSKNYEIAIEWLEESLDRFYDKSMNEIGMLNIFQHLSFAYGTLGILTKFFFVINFKLEFSFKKGYYDEALEVTENLLALNPLDEIANENRKNLQEYLNMVNFIISIYRFSITNDLKLHFIFLQIKRNKELAERKNYDANIYKQLCQNNLQQTSIEQSFLHCKYITNDLSFLSISPFKIEEMSLDPYIVRYHDVLYDTEIKYIIRKAKKTVKHYALLLV